MGPCHSSSKKKASQPQSQPPVQQNMSPQKDVNPQTLKLQPVPESDNQNFNPTNVEEGHHHHSVGNSPNKLSNEGNVHSSGLKNEDNRYDQGSPYESNIISKPEKKNSQNVKVESHFYYSQKENGSGSKLAEERIRNMDFEEHEFKEPADYKTSLHSNQINRREIFSDTNKNKFIQSKNIGDPDEPEEMAFEDLMIK